LLLAPPGAGAVVPACLAPPSSPELAAAIDQYGPQLTAAVSARYFAPAVAASFPLTENSPVIGLLAEVIDGGGRQAVILDIEINIMAACWAFLEHPMLVGWTPIPAAGTTSRDLAAFVARRADGDLPFIGVCRRERAAQLVKDVVSFSAGLFRERPASSIIDLGWALGVAGQIVATRSYAGLSAVKETPL
jgi:hypothetical protein